MYTCAMIALNIVAFAVPCLTFPATGTLTKLQSGFGDSIRVTNDSIASNEIETVANVQ